MVIGVGDQISFSGEGLYLIHMIIINFKYIDSLKCPRAIIYRGGGLSPLNLLMHMIMGQLRQRLKF